jgi:ATP-dependent RNA helicase DeaD
LIGLLLDTTNDRSIEIGKIDIMKGFSFFEVEQGCEQVILRSFNKSVRRNGQLIKVELSGASKEKPRESYSRKRKGSKTGYEYSNSSA